MLGRPVVRANSLLRFVLDTCYSQRIQRVAYAGTTNGLKRPTLIKYERPWMNIHIQNERPPSQNPTEENDECCQDCLLQTSPTWDGPSEILIRPSKTSRISA